MGYLPKNGLDLKTQFERELHSDQSRHIVAQCTRGGENYWHYKNDIIPTVSASSYEVKVDSEFDLSEKSALYPIFCKYECFKTRSMSAKLFVERATPYKFSMDVELKKDAQSVLTMEINSRNNPYIFKVNAPRILPKILPTGRQSIEFEADHKPGQYLKIKSNTNILKSFKIERMDGDMRRVELNGKELVKAGFTRETTPSARPPLFQTAGPSPPPSLGSLTTFRRTRSTSGWTEQRGSLTPTSPGTSPTLPTFS